MPYWYDSKEEPGKHQADYDQLWEELVPESGPAETAQGEVIRSAARLASEYYRNGNINWMDSSTREFYLGFVDYIERTIQEHGPAESVEAFRPFLSAVRSVGLCKADPSDFDFDPWDRLIHVAVEWCVAHPQPIPVGRPAN